MIKELWSDLAQFKDIVKLRWFYKFSDIEWQKYEIKKDNLEFYRLWNIVSRIFFKKYIFKYFGVNEVSYVVFRKLNWICRSHFSSKINELSYVL